MSFKTAAELYKDELYVLRDAGLIIERDWHKHLYDLNGEELRQEMIRLQEDETYAYFYESESFSVLKYKSLAGEDCVGSFFKLKDKFEDSSFINESDKDFIAQLVGRKDSNGDDILLGDQVMLGDSKKTYRVIWVNSGFWLYDDFYDGIHDELGTDYRLTKV